MQKLTDRNVRAKTINLLGEEKGKSSQLHNKQRILGTPTIRTIKEKVDKLDFIIIKNLLFERHH